MLVIVVRHIPISTELITNVFVLNCGFAYELVADTELPAEISVKRLRNVYKWHSVRLRVQENSKREIARLDPS